MSGAAGPWPFASEGRRACSACWGRWAEGAERCGCGCRKSTAYISPGMEMERALLAQIAWYPPQFWAGVAAQMAPFLPGRELVGRAAQALAEPEAGSLADVTFQAMCAVTERAGWHRTGVLSWLESAAPGVTEVVVHEYRRRDAGPSVHVPLTGGAKPALRVAHWATVLAFRADDRVRMEYAAWFLALAMLNPWGRSGPHETNPPRAATTRSP